MTVVILQPSYWPWRGYFHQIHRANHFVFLDNVQFDKNGWRNRNRIKTPAGIEWFTVPVRQKGRGQQLIRDVEITADGTWRKKHLKMLGQNYAKAPHFSRHSAAVEEFLGREWSRLMDLTVETTRWAADALGIRTTYHFASDFAQSPEQTGRLVDICRQLGATDYLPGPAARDYLDEEQFQRAGIAVEYMTYEYPEYPQLHGSFQSQVSILDLLFNCGPEAPKYIWKNAG